MSQHQDVSCNTWGGIFSPSDRDVKAQANLNFWESTPTITCFISPRGRKITEHSQSPDHPDIRTVTMSDNGVKAGPEPSERTTIGITFGNSNSSIAYLVDDKAEVIANEDGGKRGLTWCRPGRILILSSPRPSDPHHPLVRRWRRVLRPAGQELPRQEPQEHSRLLPRLPRERVQVDRPYPQPRLCPPARVRRDRLVHHQGQGGRGGGPVNTLRLRGCHPLPPPSGRLCLRVPRQESHVGRHHRPHKLHRQAKSRPDCCRCRRRSRGAAAHQRTCRRGARL
jgi:hypothetical protein